MNGSNDTGQELRAGAVAVVERLRGAGFEALWAGGCVRDQVMGLAPKDYDVATAARPEQVMRLFDRTVAVGAQFGVVLVLLGERQYEVATFRADLGYSDGRHPDQVAWASAREDVARRDFTINGLLYDPVADELLDYVGGRADIRGRLVRAIGDPAARFAEDRLRMLRAVRFAARFGFAIEHQTWQAVRQTANEIGQVSVERIAAELEHILTQGGAAEGLRLLAEAGLLRPVLPQLGDAERAAARFAGAGSVSPALAWATALYDCDGSPEAILRGLRRSSAQARAVDQAVALARRVADGYVTADAAARKRILRTPLAPLALATLERAVEAGQADGEPLSIARADRARWTATELHPPKLIDGRALRQRGYTPGPFFAHALDAVEDGQLRDEVVDEAQAWELVERLADRFPGAASGS